MATKRKELTVKEKLKIIDEREYLNITERNLAAKHGVSKSQIHRILENKENIRQQSKFEGVLKRRRVNRMFFSFFSFSFNLQLVSIDFFLINSKFTVRRS